MPNYLTVRRIHGPAWNEALPKRSQPQWPEHAAFMNALASEGFIVLGGPVGSGEDTLLVFNTDREDEVHARLAPDPWTISGLLVITHIEPWEVLLDGGTTRQPR